MKLTRREFVAVTAASAAVIVDPAVVIAEEEKTMYGLIGKINTVAGKRDELITILLEGVSGMSGCLSYVIAKDSVDEDAIWVTEVWESQERHQASLSLESVQQAIAKGRPLISGFGERFETIPVGGHGLV